jgi:hypothetical protein
MGIIFRTGYLNLKKDLRDQVWQANAHTGIYIYIYRGCNIHLFLIIKYNLIIFIILFHDPYRYKIYIEGYAWSVSQKYILACDSVTLLVKPKHYDFFTRSLQPLHHYWPVREDDKCKSIKFAVDWGNNHKQKVSLSTKHNFLFGNNYTWPFQSTINFVRRVLLHIRSRMLTFCSENHN